jgi:hypothetical protein
VPEQWAIEKRPRWYVEVHDAAADDGGDTNGAGDDDGDELASGEPTTAR